VESFETGWRKEDVVRIVDDFGIVVMPRQGVKVRNFVDHCSWLAGHTRNVILVDVNPFENVSSTMVRKRLGTGGVVDGLVLPGIEQYIQERYLYRMNVPVSVF
jgi:nicotinic acid mononucleotide adenylyltransferase